jgi:hypothetical protein
VKLNLVFLTDVLVAYLRVMLIHVGERSSVIGATAGEEVSMRPLLPDYGAAAAPNIALMRLLLPIDPEGSSV